MILLKDFLKPWREVIAQNKAEIVAGGWFTEQKVKFQFAEWTVTLDESVTIIRGNTLICWRMRTRAMNPNGFWFKVKPRYPVHKALTFMRQREIETGDKDFDAAFILRGNNADDIRKLLQHEGLQANHSGPRSTHRENFSLKVAQ
jgi:hypothetical protein